MITPSTPTTKTLSGSMVVADAAGRAFDGFGEQTLSDPELTFGGVNSIVGRSIVIHGDVSSASVRVAMCVIGVAQESTTAKEGGSEVSPTRTTRSVGAVAMTARVAGVRASATSGTWVHGAGFTGNSADKYWGYVRAASKPAGLVTGLQLIDNAPAAAKKPIGGTVTVYEEVDATGKPGLHLRYTINWASGETVKESGIHIHEGTTCADPKGHFWNEDAVGTDDPWADPQKPVNWAEAVPRAEPNQASRASMGTTHAVYAGVSLCPRPPSQPSFLFVKGIIFSLLLFPPPPPLAFPPCFFLPLSPNVTTLQLQLQQQQPHHRLYTKHDACIALTSSTATVSVPLSPRTLHF
jgi:hypothetical protein